VNGEGEENFPGYMVLGSGTAVPLKARAMPSYWIFGFGKAGIGTAVPLQARLVPAYWRFLAQFFSFS